MYVYEKLYQGDLLWKSDKIQKKEVDETLERKQLELWPGIFHIQQMTWQEKQTEQDEAVVLSRILGWCLLLLISPEK